MEQLRKKVKELREQGTFKSEVLFNGSSSNCEGLTKEEMNELSKRFKKFVDDNVLALMNSEVEFILNAQYDNIQQPPFTWDDVLNTNQYDNERIISDILYTFDNLIVEENKNITLNKLSQDEKDNIKYFLEVIHEDLYQNLNDVNKTREILKEYLGELVIEELHELVEDERDTLEIDNLYEYEQQTEIMQWFLVSSYLCSLLNEQHECIIDSYNYWGRQTFGQSIELDGVMHEIFLDIFTKGW